MIKTANIEKKYFIADDIIDWWDPEGEKASFSRYFGTNNKVKELLAGILHDSLKSLDLKDKKVLDTGVGKGRFAINMAKNGAYDVIGLDLNKKMIILTRNRIKEIGLDKKVKLIQGDIEQLPLLSQKFDVVCCMETLIHVPDLYKAIKELSRVLKKGGKLVVNVPPKTSYLGYLEYCSIIEIVRGFFNLLKQRIITGEKKHARFVSKKSFEKILLNSGFCIEKRINYGKYFTILITYICVKK